MANRGINILKVPIDPDAFKEEIKEAGYSIRGIAKFSGVGDRTLRYYLERKEMPIAMRNRIYAALGKKKRMVDADLLISKLNQLNKGFDDLSSSWITVNQVHKLLNRIIGCIEMNIEEETK